MLLSANMNTTPSTSSLRPEVQWNLPSRLPALLFAVAVAGVGGFMGGLLTSYGPRILNVHVTEAFHGDPVEQAAVLSEVEPAATLEPAVIEPEEVLVATEELPLGAEARLVMHGKAKSYVVLNPAPESSWGTGPKRVRGDDFAFTMTQKVPNDVLGPEILAWQGRQLSLYSTRGYTCTATVGAFALLQNSFEDDDSGDSVTREFIEGTFQLVAELEPLRGRCKAAVWARDAALPAPSLGHVARPTKSIRRHALRSYRQSPIWKKLQRKFNREGLKGNWDQMFDSNPTILSMRSASEELVLVSANQAGCGEFDGTLSLVFQVQPDGSLRELDSSEVFVAEVTASADIDGDGDLDFVGSGSYSDTLLVKQGPALSIASKTDVLVNVCGC